MALNGGLLMVPSSLTIKSKAETDLAALSAFAMMYHRLASFFMQHC